MSLIHSILKISPNFKGKLRLARLLVRNKEKEHFFSTSNEVKYYVPNLTEIVSFELFVNGIYEKETIDFIVNNVPENGVFVDVGANVGAISIEVALQRPDIEIFSFEASRIVYNFLDKNKKINNCRNLNIYNLAIHEKDSILIDFYSPESLNGKGSFSPVFTSESEKVLTRRLDVFFHENGVCPDLIKVDVEGYELTVFKSMNNFLKNNVDCKILFEFVDWAEKEANFENGSAQLFLREIGYKLFNFPSCKIIQGIQKSGSLNILAKKVV